MSIDTALSIVSTGFAVLKSLYDLYNTYKGLKTHLQPIQLDLRLLIAVYGKYYKKNKKENKDTPEYMLRALFKKFIDHTKEMMEKISDKISKDATLKEKVNTIFDAEDIQKDMDNMKDRMAELRKWSQLYSLCEIQVDIKAVATIIVQGHDANLVDDQEVLKQITNEKAREFWQTLMRNETKRQKVVHN